MRKNEREKDLDAAMLRWPSAGSPQELSRLQTRESVTEVFEASHEPAKISHCRRLFLSWSVCKGDGAVGTNEP